MKTNLKKEKRQSVMAIIFGVMVVLLIASRIPYDRVVQGIFALFGLIALAMAAYSEYRTSKRIKGLVPAKA